MQWKSREIAEDFSFTLPQVRRWAVLVLGIDPLAAKGKGTIREYSTDEAFKIYLVGKFITWYRMGLQEAKHHVNNLWPKFVEFNLLPSQNPTLKINSTVQIYIHPNYNYDFRFLISGETISKDQFKAESVESYKTVIFNPQELTRYELGPIWIIGFTFLLERFFKRVMIRKSRG